MSSAKSLRRSLHGQEFSFSVGDLVLVKWHDGMVYFAKIKKVDFKKRKCTVVFDDKSQDEAHFTQIHSVDETTTDIICIKCKKDDSENPNEIVLCDACGIGYHQKCHAPPIPTSALKLDTPWQCTYCIHGEKCPYLTESLDVLQNLLSDDCGSSSDVEPPMETRSTRKSRRNAEGKQPKTNSEPRVSSRLATPPNERKQSPLSNVDVVRHKLASVTPSDKNNQHDNQCQSKRSENNSTEPSPEPQRRKKKHGHHKKKHNRRSPVDTCTLSVTRLPPDTSNEPATPGKETATVQIDSAPILERRPRSLRVSLSLQEDGDGKIKTPLSVKTPLETEKNTVFPTVTLKSLEKKPAVSTVSSGKPVEPFPVFTASPLPTSSSSHFLPDFNSITDMFELSSSSENDILKTAVLAGSKATEGDEPMDTTGPIENPIEKPSTSPNIAEAKKVCVVKKTPSPVLTDTPIFKTPPVSNETLPVIDETPPVSNGTPPTSNKEPPIDSQSSSVNNGAPPEFFSKKLPPVSNKPPPINTGISPTSNGPAPMSNQTPPVSKETPPSTVIKSATTPPINIHTHSNVKSPASSKPTSPPSSLPSKPATVHSKVWTVPVLDAPVVSDSLPIPPSSVPVISSAAKRPLQDDVIITAVEKSFPPPSAKKPRLESPIQSKPDQLKKDISVSRHQTASTPTSVLTPPNTTPTSFLHQTTQTTVLAPPSHPHMTPTQHSRLQIVRTTALTPPSHPHMTPTHPHTTVLAPPSHPHTAHTTVLTHPLDSPHPPKPQYVYCVQSSGQPVYIPANVTVHPQVLSRHTSKAPPPSLPPGYEIAPVNTTKPYAIVSALPSSTGMNVYQRQIASAGETPVIVENPHALEKLAVSKSPPVLNSKPSGDHKVQSRNIIAAPVNKVKEDFLLSNFDDAWKKIQANGTRYKTVSKPSPGVFMSKPRPRVPPNAEVIPGTGHMTARVPMVRPVGQRLRTVNSKVLRICARCGCDATYLCSGCRTEWYCGRECQLKSWDSHSEACKH